MRETPTWGWPVRPYAKSMHVRKEARTSGPLSPPSGVLATRLGGGLPYGSCPQAPVLFSAPPHPAPHLLRLGLQRPQTPSPASECSTMWSLCRFPALVRLEHRDPSSRPLEPAFGRRHRRRTACPISISPSDIRTRVNIYVWWGRDGLMECDPGHSDSPSRLVVGSEVPKHPPPRAHGWDGLDSDHLPSIVTSA